MNSQLGGGLFKTTPSFIKKFKTARKSETEVLSMYKAYAKANMKYNKAYEKHMTNLTELDKAMPEDFEGFTPVFKDFLMSDVRTTDKPDKSSPLLLANYRVEYDADRDDLAKRHLWQQCEYIRRTKFAPQDAMLINKMAITSPLKTTFVLTTTGINFGRDKYETINHTGYKANQSEIKAALGRMIEMIKRDIVVDAAKNSVMNKPVADIFSPVTPAAVSPVVKERAPPIHDIYGVDRLHDAPKAPPATPMHGDEKPKFGAEKPKFDFGKPVGGDNKPDYLKQPPVVADAPPTPQVGSEAKADSPFAGLGERPKFTPPQPRPAPKQDGDRPQYGRQDRQGYQGRGDNPDYGARRNDRGQGYQPRGDKPDYGARRNDRGQGYQPRERGYGDGGYGKRFPRGSRRQDRAPRGSRRGSRLKRPQRERRSRGRGAPAPPEF